MRRISFPYRLTLLSFFSTVLFSACTLMDNDLRGLPDTPGFKEMVHIENEEGSIDYQYNPNTKVLDRSFLTFISSMDYANRTLYLYDFIPDDLLPEEGDVLAAEKSEKLEWGLSHNVRGVRREGNLYAVSVEQATLDEVFKHLVVDCETYFALSSGEPTSDISEETEPTDTALTRSWVKVGKEEWEAIETRAENSREDEAAKNDPEHAKWQHSGNLGTQKINVLGLLLGKHVTGLGIVASQIIPGGWTLSGSYTPKGGESALSYNFDANAKIEARITPVVKVRNFINIDEKKFDVYLKLGGKFELEMAFAGSIYLKFDMWKFFGLPSLPPVQLGAALAGLPLFYETGFSLVFDATLSGSYSRTWEKDFAITVGARYNIPNEENGVYATKENPDAKSIVDEEWNVESEYEFKFSVGLTFSIVPELYFGSPVEAPRLGLRYSPSIGLRFDIGRTSDKTTVGESTMKLYVPVRFADIYAYFKFWKSLEFSYNIGDAIVKAIGGKDANAEVVLWEKIWHLYPSIDDLALVCTNFLDKSSTPKFKLDFDVKNMGVNATKEMNLRPVVEILDEGGNVLLKKNNFEFCNKYSAVKHFTWSFENPKIQHDKKYTARIYWTRTGLYGENRLYYKKQDFTTYTPSFYIVVHDISAQRVKYSELTKDSYKNGVAAYPYTPNKQKCKGYQYDFSTMVRINNYNKISSWGFYVGSNKSSTFTIKEPPISSGAYIYFTSSKKKWSKKSDKTYKLWTWTKSGEALTVWPEPYTMKLSYDESRNEKDYSGKKDKEGHDIPYIMDVWDYVYGYHDKTKNPDNGYTYDVNKGFSYASRNRTGGREEWSDDNLPVYVINLDECEDEMEED